MHRQIQITTNGNNDFVLSIFNENGEKIDHFEIPTKESLLEYLQSAFIDTSLTDGSVESQTPLDYLSANRSLKSVKILTFER